MKARHERSATLQKFVHFMTALTMIMKGITKLEHPTGYWPIIIFFFATGLYITTITLLHDRLHAHMKLLDATVLALESMATGLVAWLFLVEGTRYLHYFFAFASVMFAIACAVRLLRGRSAAQHH
jgi:hypothetical protein